MLCRRACCPIWVKYSEIRRCEISANFPSNMVRWFWWDDDSRWKPYNKGDSDLIEAAYVGGKVDSVSLAGGLYK